MTDIYSELLKQAQQVSKNAYVPYSHFPVGAALYTRQGQVFAGCNVENAAYGVCICAEQNAISSAVSAGVKPGDILQLVLFIDDTQLYSPCGACRQVMSEFMDADSLVSASNGTQLRKDWRMTDLLPDGFNLPG